MLCAVKAVCNNHPPFSSLVRFLQELQQAELLELSP
jgi:hypothetical protein